MEHEICPVREWTEEADVEVVAVLFGLEGAIWGDLAVERIVRARVPGGGKAVGVGHTVNGGANGRYELVESLEHLCLTELVCEQA